MFSVNSERRRRSKNAEKMRRSREKQRLRYASSVSGRSIESHSELRNDVFEEGGVVLREKEPAEIYTPMVRIIID
jgi:hypothetical protein